jgi:3-keto-5-aminohexanoate cleavage enzyme
VNPVIVEVGLNEAAPRALNGHVPYSAAECAADALRCGDAGASVVHWHARDAATGAQRLDDAESYGAALAPMRRAGLLAYPSYPVEPLSLDGRFGHCWTLRERHGLEMAPVDVGSVSIVPWDERTRTFVGLDALGDQTVVANPLPLTLAALENIQALGMVPSLTSFDVGNTRTVALLAESGALSGPVYLKIFLSGAWAVGPTPTEEAIEYHLRQLPPELDVAWVLVPYALSDARLVERLCRRALELGGGIRVGIGDTPAAFPEASNAEVVAMAVRWVEESGRPLASTADVRMRLGLPPAEVSHG